jgi:pSer/pThr/pTyr-binding forkhead associated (FHA) protein
MKRAGIADPTDDLPHGPHLVIVEGEGAGRVFPLQSTTRIGRDPGGDIVLPHATVSWHHAVITTGREGIVAEDLGSRNGTFVGVERIARRALAEGDVLAIGDRVALKLAFLAPPSPNDRTPVATIARAAAIAPAATLDRWAASGPLVANAAALVDRLRKERAAALDPDVSLVLMFIGLPALSAPSPEAAAPEAEQLMRPLTAACREALDAGDFLARAAERELIVLSRATVARAAQLGERIQAAAVKRFARAGVGAAVTPTVVLVPIPFHAAVGAETLLLVAARRVAAVPRVTPGLIRTVPLHESLH